MTAPLPTLWPCTQANGTASQVVTCNVGDLIVVVQGGQASGTTAPVAPTSGSGGSWAGGASLSGADGYANAGASGGRTTIWGKLAAAGDNGANVTVSTTGYTTPNRWALIVIPGPWSASRVAQLLASTANTGSTPFSLTDVPRGAILIAACSYATAQGALTVTYDGATSGTKFQRAPFSDENTGTDTTIDHTHHYGTGTGQFQIDFQEYDGPDTLSSVLFNNGMANTTHAFVALVYQLALTLTLGTAASASTAQPLAKKKARTLGTAASTGTSQHLGVSHLRFANTAASASTAQPLAKKKARTLGTASSSSAAQHLTRPGHVIAIGTAASTSAAQPLTATKTWSAEVSIANPPGTEVVYEGFLTASKNLPGDAGDIMWSIKKAGVLLVQSGWIALTNTPTQLALTFPTPQGGTGFSIAWSVRTSTSLDPLITMPYLLTSILLGSAPEAGAAQPLGRKKARALGTAPSTSTSQHLARGKAHTIAGSNSTSTAQHLARSKTRMLGTASSTSAAGHLTRPGHVNTATSAGTAQHLARGKRRTIGTASSTSTAGDITIATARVITIGSASTQSFAQRLLATVQGYRSYEFGPARNAWTFGPAENAWGFGAARNAWTFGRAAE